MRAGAFGLGGTPTAVLRKAVQAQYTPVARPRASRGAA